VPPGIGPELPTRVAPGLHERQVVRVAHGDTIDAEWPDYLGVSGAFVVVGGAPFIGSYRNLATGDADHPAKGPSCIGKRAPRTGVIRLALFQLECLQNGFVVLVFVLEHHVIDKPGTQQRMRRCEVRLGEPLEHAETGVGHESQNLGETGECQCRALVAGMLHGIEQSRHFHELDFAVQIPGQPEFFEVRNVAEVPDDRAHERIVLDPEIVGCERPNQLERAGPRLN
jgi:hypothetical protein